MENNNVSEDKNTKSINSISFGDNVTGIQIQQNTENSNQTQRNTYSYNYEAVQDVISEIYKFKEDFSAIYGSSSKIIETELELIKDLASKKEQPSKISSSFSAIRDLTIGISGSLIASGILQLITPFII